jgi:hypothetical protein
MILFQGDRNSKRGNAPSPGRYRVRPLPEGEVIVANTSSFRDPFQSLAKWTLSQQIKTLRQP